MELENFTPFPSIVWENAGANNDWYATFVSKIKLDIKPQKDSQKLHLQLSPNQGELNLSEIFHGEKNNSSLRYDSDLIVYKQNTDVVLNAKAYSPFGIKRKNWHCGVRIFEPNGDLIKDYSLGIKGEKEFTKLGIVWVPKIREKVSEVPIRYERAYGGTIKTDEGKIIKIKPFNPVGCGIKKIRDVNDIVYSPQINYFNQVFTQIPAGFGFIGKTWKNRLKYIGTYDEKWLKNKYPYLPDDFDYMYYQSAHPELIMNGYIKPETTIELYNLTKNNRKVYFKVPKFELIARLKFHTGETFQKMNLDTLVIDIDHDDETNNCIYASYRARIKKIHEIQSSQIMLLKKGEKDG